MIRRTRGFAGDQRGHAMLEFGVASALLIGCLAGTWQFGYSFYVYNQLESAVNNGGRYGGMRTYRSQGTDDAARVRDKVKNMVVYGVPNPSQSANPVVRGLTTSNVDVTYTLDPLGVPTAVTVKISSFQVDAIFTTFTFTDKPKVTYPFLGRYAPHEMEP